MTADYGNEAIEKHREALIEQAGPTVPQTEAGRSMTPAERDIRDRHKVDVRVTGISWCGHDQAPQPCDSQVLIGILDRQRDAVDNLREKVERALAEFEQLAGTYGYNGDRAKGSWLTARLAIRALLPGDTAPGGPIVSERDSDGRLLADRPWWSKELREKVERPDLSCPKCGVNSHDNNGEGWTHACDQRFLGALANLPDRFALLPGDTATEPIDPAQFPYRWEPDEMVSDHPFRRDTYAGCADCRRLRSQHTTEVGDTAPEPPRVREALERLYEIGRRIYTADQRTVAARIAMTEGLGDALTAAKDALSQPVQTPEDRP
jgi:hypothetical protein